MENMEPKGGAQTVPGVAPQEAPALVISGVKTYNKLIYELAKSNPIVASILARRAAEASG